MKRIHNQEESYKAYVVFESDEDEVLPPSKIHKRDLANSKNGGTESKHCPQFSLQMKAYNIRKKSPYLSIPLGFCAKNGLVENARLTLKGPGGKQEVSMRACRSGSFVFLSRGWPKFIDDNNVQVGDVCIFKFHGSGTSSDGASFDVEVIKNNQNMQPPIGERAIRKPSKQVQPPIGKRRIKKPLKLAQLPIGKRPIRRPRKRAEDSLDGLKAKVVSLEAEMTKLNRDMDSMRLLYTEQQKLIENLQDTLHSSSKSGGNVTPGDVGDHEHVADFDIIYKIYEAEATLVESPKRKAAQPDSYTPGTDTIQKRKKPSCARIDCPFSKDPFATLSINDEREMFDAYILHGVASGLDKTQSTPKYIPEVDNLVHLVFDPSVVIEKKSWLYQLHQPGQWLDALHVQTVMLYLRVKASVFEYRQKFSTACTYFPGYINFLFDRASDPSQAAKDPYFLEESGGDDALHLRPWSQSDYVYFPLNLSQQHWVLVVLDVQAGKLRIFDSNNRDGSINHEAVHELRGIINYLPSLLNGSAQLSAFSYEFVEGVPQQENGGDCGFFMLKFAELLQMGMDVKELDVVKIPDYRAKWAHDLYLYGSNKGKTLVV